eukprot:c39986_g1_i1.p2 GENE.c39986_g1_i1~~c39986_g1_i1.p2  ORF type:complete len:299 (+),score=51.83 c39986_g1_i1:69-899(+)
MSDSSDSSRKSEDSPPKSLEEQKQELELWSDALRSRVRKLQSRDDDESSRALVEVCQEFARVCELLEEVNARLAERTPVRKRKRHVSATPVREDEQPKLTPVTLHVYDLKAGAMQTSNRITTSVGLGAYHAALEVHGVEYYFTFDVGITSCMPGENDCHAYLKPIVLGQTDVSKRDLRELLTRMEGEWTAESYDLLGRNCCHFAEALSIEIGTGPIPAWINRAARVGDSVASLAKKIWGIGIQSRVAGFLSSASKSSGSSLSAADDDGAFSDDRAV